MLLFNYCESQFKRLIFSKEYFIASVPRVFNQLVAPLFDN